MVASTTVAFARSGRLFEGFWLGRPAAPYAQQSDTPLDCIKDICLLFGRVSSLPGHIVRRLQIRRRGGFRFRLVGVRRQQHDLRRPAILLRLEQHQGRRAPGSDLVKQQPIVLTARRIGAWRPRRCTPTNRMPNITAIFRGHRRVISCGLRYRDGCRCPWLRGFQRQGYRSLRHVSAGSDPLPERCRRRVPSRARASRATGQAG